eukprot:406759-Lingulodinium_polyedra.AAC.1
MVLRKIADRPDRRASMAPIDNPRAPSGIVAPKISDAPVLVVQRWTHNTQMPLLAGFREQYNHHHT